MSRILLILVIACSLVACHSETPAPQNSRYSMANDGAPKQTIDVSQIPNAVPKNEPRSKSGNPDAYEVFGQTYHVAKTSAGYDQKGIASWYGTKFNGHSTSSGEPYDMYAMTAAHKTLPLPTYVKVVNLNNGKEVVVKVNDRGPFHTGRIIDLSYAAAKKLGMLNHGTAPVEVIALTTPKAIVDTSKKMGQGIYLQAGAFHNKENAERMGRQLATLIQSPVNINAVKSHGKSLYRVQIGPLTNLTTSEQIDHALVSHGYSHPITVIR